MAGLIGKKIGMTSLYDDKGNNLACTVIQAGPCVVTQIKNIEKDGYNAIQVGFDDKKERLVTKSELGHFKNSKQSPKSKLMEFSNSFHLLPQLILALAHHTSLYLQKYL